MTKKEMSESFNEKIRELGQLISPLVSPIKQKEELLINRDELIKDINRIIPTSNALIEVALENSTKYSDLERNLLLIPDLFADKFGGIEMLDKWLDQRGRTKEEIQKTINFSKYKSTPLADLINLIKQRNENFDSRIQGYKGLVHNWNASVLILLFNINKFISRREIVRDYDNILRSLKDFVLDNEIFKEALANDNLKNLLINALLQANQGKQIQLKSFIHFLHELWKYLISTKKIIEIWKSAVKSLEDLKNIKHFTTLVSLASSFDSGEFLEFKEDADKAPTFTAFLIMGFLEELENWANYEFLSRNQISYSADIFPTVFIRECAIFQLNRERFADDLLQYKKLTHHKRVREDEIHHFLLHHPRFLLGAKYTYLYEKLRLLKPDGNILIPDFTLVKPDRSIDILELKRPNLKRFIVGKPDRERFSQFVMDAIQQAREYKRWFEDEQNRHWFEDTYGYLRLKALQPEVTLIVSREDELRDSLIFRRLEKEIQDITIKTFFQLYEEADLIYQNMVTI